MRRRKDFDWNHPAGIYVCPSCDKPFHRAELIYKGSSIDIHCPDCDGVHECRRLGPKEIELAVAREERTKAIVAGALAFVEEKRAEGWTQKDFARGLAEMLGIIIDEIP